MSIYSRRHRTSHKVYKKIYENHHGPVPKDEFGRSYDIHHIDGDHSNNDPSNLKAVSIQEHYEIHRTQKDWGSCWSISLRLHLSADEVKYIAGEAGKIGGAKARERVKNGTCNLQRRPDGSSVTGNRVKNGTHPFIGANKGSKNSRFDDTIYTFKHIDTGEEVNATRYDFMKMYSLENQSGNITNMIKHGKFNHIKRWSVVR